MWKTLGGFWVQMDPFAYILPPETGHIHCGATGLALFRRPYVLQSVHMLIDGDFDRPWHDGERRRTEFVIIGRALEPDALRAGFAACVA
ncbi:MAG: GTP-binding protein [Cyanobacteria bacterium M_surface_10_m1_298]|nr:GTP-binding protein [Cyanobacteria bacterium M_surface_10_m1_298]